MRILGIDPGSAYNGWALFDDNELIDRGQIVADSRLKWGLRLNMLTAQFRGLIMEKSPDIIAIEKTTMGGGDERTAAQAFSQGANTRDTEELAGCIGMMAARQGIDVVRVTPQGSLSALGCRWGAKDREVRDAFLRRFPDTGKMRVQDHHEARAAGVALRGEAQWRIEKRQSSR
jgi:Holliday junction resolvasome RuvABC endonuclease subunit